MVGYRRPLAIALTFLIAVAAVTFAIDVTTLRIAPDVSHLQTPTYGAFPGERIRVELDRGWSPIRSSNPAAVAPIGGNWFVAAGPGTATLSAASIRCPRCAMATILWRAIIRVGLPGT